MWEYISISILAITALGMLACIFLHSYIGIIIGCGILWTIFIITCLKERERNNESQSNINDSSGIQN